jgi:hypothetical protein
MKFKPSPIQIPAADPFKEDLLSRKQAADVLTSFVSSLKQPFVLAIDSPWGTGKTTFLKMWLQHLRNQNFHCLYFNAWETDFTDSPLVSLIGEVGAEIEKLELGEDSKIAKLFEKTKKIGASLLKSAAPTALKLATAGLLDLEGLKAEDVTKLAENIAKKQIEKYQADKKTIHHFRDELKQLVAALSESDGASTKPVIFVVDELDRCRPPYAVELLEKIKHLFSVEGLAFVLALDWEQLGASVRSMYGQGMNSDGYLRRFVDLKYHLPEATGTSFVHSHVQSLGLASLLASGEANCLRETFPHLFQLFGFSLRVQEQIFTHVALIARTTPENQQLFPYLLSVLLCLRVANPELYKRYCRGEAGNEDVMKYLRALPKGEVFAESDLGCTCEAFLIFGMRDEKKRNAARAAFKQHAHENVEAESKQRAQAVWHNLGMLSLHPGNIIGYLFDQIELTQPFSKLTPQPTP